MKITQYGRLPKLVGTTTNSTALGGVTIGSNTTGGVQPDYAWITTSSNSAIWRPNVHTITANSSNAATPPVVNFAGAGIVGVSLASNTLTIAGTLSYASNSNDVAAAGAAGVSTSASRADHVHRGVTSLTHTSNTFYGPVTLIASGSLGITSPASGTFNLSATGGGGGGGGGAPTDAKYVVSAADGTLSAEIVLPGIAASADIPPASPNADDDEFNTTDTSDPMTGWTTLQTPTSHDINSTAKSHYYVKRTAVGTAAGHVGIYKSWTPSANDTITCKVTDYVQSAVNFQRGAMLWVSEATPGKLALMSMTQDGSGPRLLVMNYTAPGTFGSTAVASGAAFTFFGPLYLQVRYVSSTNIGWYVSKSGLLWTPIHTGHNVGFTIGAFGIGVDTQQTTRDGEAIFDWVRKNWTAGT